jgi:hypothetical protein
MTKRYIRAFLLAFLFIAILIADIYFDPFGSWKACDIGVVRKCASPEAFIFLIASFYFYSKITDNKWAKQWEDTFRDVGRPYRAIFWTVILVSFILVGMLYFSVGR